MLRCFRLLKAVRGRVPLSLAILVSLPLACLGGFTLYEGVHQPLGQIELVGNPGQPVTQSNIMDTLQSLEHHFKENKGQLTNPAVRYYYSQADFGVAFTDTGVIYRLTGESSAVVTLRFEGANPVQPEGDQMYDHLSHYFYGNDPTQWITGVRSYTRVIYPEVYNRVDLVYYFTAEGLKYDLVVKPGADPRVIRFRYEGTEHLTLDADGSLTAHTAAGSLRDQALYMYQDTPAGRQNVEGTFTLYNVTTFGFQVMEPYSPLYPLILDPLIWSTLIGGSGDDAGLNAFALDSTNNAYVTGWTVDAGTNFPTTPGAYNETHSGIIDAFVCKLSADGSSLLYSTFLGGSGIDYGYGLTVDSANNTYVTGWTASTNFPITPGAFDETLNGSTDAFVCKLSADGSSLLYSTFLGGSGVDYGYGLTADSANNTYVTGHTASTDFPTTSGAFNETYSGNYDAFVCKLSADGSSLLYSTFLGGSGDDRGDALAIDSANNVYVTGYTVDAATNFPTTPGAYDETQNGNYDAFVCKLGVDGSSLLYSTFLGGSGDDFGYSLAVDSVTNVYVTGRTVDAGTDFPTTSGAYNETHNGGTDAFVCKLGVDGSSLLYSTFLGGSVDDWALALAVDSATNVYIVGRTDSTDFPTTSGAYDETHSGSTDAFVCKLSTDGSDLLYSTFLGGSGTDRGFGLAVDSATNVYIMGRTTSTDFPTTSGAFNETHSGGWDVFVSKIALIPPTISLISPVNDSINQSGTIIDLIIADDDSVSHVLYNWDAAPNNTLADPYNLSLPSVDGQHILHVYANDTDGLWASQTYVFTTDDTNPIITLNNPTSPSIQQSGTTIDLNVMDPNGLTQVLYNWDGSTNTTFSSPYDVTLPEGDGDHTLRVYARDTAGNWASLNFIFTTDDTDPTILLISPEEGSNSPPDTQILLRVEDAHTIQVVYNWDGNANTTLLPPYDAITDIFLPAVPGAHVLRVYVQDQAGNWASATYIFTTDDTPLTTPTVTITVTVTPTTSSTTSPTPTDFLTIEIFLLGLGVLAVIVWRRKKQRVG